MCDPSLCRCLHGLQEGKKGDQVFANSWKGTRKNPYMLTKCIVVEDHGNGTFKVQWKEGESKGTVSRNFGGHRLRLIEEEEVGACL